MNKQIAPLLYFFIGIILTPLLWYAFLWHIYFANDETLNDIFSAIHLLFFAAPLIILLFLKNKKAKALTFFIWLIACIIFPCTTFALTNFIYDWNDLDERGKISLSRLIIAGPIVVTCFFFLSYYILKLFFQNKLSSKKTYLSLFSLFLWGGMFPVNLANFCNFIGYALLSADSTFTIGFNILTIIGAAILFISMGIFIFLEKKTDIY